MKYFLLVTYEVRFLLNIYFFTSLLLLYLGEVKKFKVILKAKSAVGRLAIVRMRLAQPGYGSGLSPPVYYRQNKRSIKFYLSSTFT